MAKKVLSIALLISLLLIPCAAQDQQELVFNGGFEAGSIDGTDPEGWFATRLPETSEFVEFTWDADVKHSGERSVQVAIGPGHPLQTIDYNWTQLLQGWRPGKKHKLTAFIKTENVIVTPSVVTQCWDEGFANVIAFGTSQLTHEIVGTSDWTKVKFKFKVPHGTAAVVLRAALRAPANVGGRVWFDDISVTEK